MQTCSGHYEYNKGIPRSADPVVAALTRLIHDCERELAALKRKRKSHVTRLRIVKMREVPGFWARNLAGRGNLLPPMTKEQRNRYHNLTNHKKVPRAEALRSMGFDVT